MLTFKSYYSSSAGNLYTCSDKETHIIIDLGVPYKKAQKALSYRMGDYSCALIGHRHLDHCKGVTEAISRAMDCYIIKDTKEHLGISGHRVHVMKPLKQFNIGSFKILPFPLEHDVPNVGFLVESKNGGKLVYINDTNYCRYKFKNLTNIAVCCNYDTEILRKLNINPSLKNRILRSHFSLENVKTFLRVNDLSRVVEIHLLHLSSRNSDAGRFKKEIEGLAGIPTIIAGE